jgi:valyl-tRNA synthetase
MHPIMPYITEEIWQSIKPLTGRMGDTLMLEPYPKANRLMIDKQANTDMLWLQTFISSLRQIRSEMDIKPKVRINILMQNWTKDDQKRFANTELFIQSLAKVDQVTWLDKQDEAPESATALVGELKVLIPLAGLIDKEAETARLNKEIDKKQKGIQGLEGRLNNPNFTDKAPEAIVNQVRQQHSEQVAAMVQLQQQLEKIQAL